MRFKVVSITGQSITFEEGESNIVSGVEGLVNPNFNKRYPAINWDNVFYIAPEPEGKSGVTHTPKPIELKTEREKDKQEMMKDPRLVLKRATDKNYNK